MSFNVGNGLLTAHISSNRLHEISEKKTPPEVTLWGKIKDFFFSTHQEEALSCIYKLYHHSDFDMSNERIREVFITLRTLASPGCKDKFIISHDGLFDEYIIDGEKILSVPRLTNQHISQDQEEDIWYDCLDNDEQAVAVERDSGTDSLSQINIPASAENTMIKEESSLSSEAAYIQGVINIVPLIEQHVLSLGMPKIGYVLGTNLVKTYKLASSIKRKIESKVNDKQEFKKDFDKLILIPGIMKLLSDEIINMPEFVIVQKG